MENLCIIVNSPEKILYERMEKFFREAIETFRNNPSRDLVSLSLSGEFPYLDQEFLKGYIKDNYISQMKKVFNSSQELSKLHLDALIVKKTRQINSYYFLQIKPKEIA